MLLGPQVWSASPGIQQHCEGYARPLHCPRSAFRLCSTTTTIRSLPYPTSDVVQLQACDFRPTLAALAAQMYPSSPSSPHPSCRPLTPTSPPPQLPPPPPCPHSSKHWTSGESCTHVMRSTQWSSASSQHLGDTNGCCHFQPWLAACSMQSVKRSSVACNLASIAEAARDLPADWQSHAWTVQQSGGVSKTAC